MHVHLLVSLYLAETWWVHSGVVVNFHLPERSSVERRRREIEGMGRGLPLPSLLGGLGERRKLPSGVRGGAPATNNFGTF